MSFRNSFNSDFCLKLLAWSTRSSANFSNCAQMSSELASGCALTNLEMVLCSEVLMPSRMFDRWGPFLRMSCACKTPFGSSLKKYLQTLYASSTDGCSSSQPFILISARDLPTPPATMVRYSATAERWSLDSDLAVLSQTQQCMPRRPEYTKSKCLNPKSLRKAR